MKEIISILEGMGINSLCSDIKHNYIKQVKVLEPETAKEEKIFKESPAVKEEVILKQPETIDIKKRLSEIKTLDELRQEIINYEGCSLKKTATNTVFGVGNQNAKVLIVGEAPGADEDLKGEPFVGRSGQLLTKALEYINLTRDNMFITNSVFWRPPGNRTPIEEEIKICLPFLEKIITIMKPEVILTFGKVAITALHEENNIPLGKLRGKWYNKQIVGEEGECSFSLRALYHPAYLLRTPTQKKVFWQDLLEVSNKIEQISQI